MLDGSQTEVYRHGALSTTHASYTTSPTELILICARYSRVLPQIDMVADGMEKKTNQVMIKL